MYTIVTHNKSTLVSEFSDQYTIADLRDTLKFLKAGYEDHFDVKWDRTAPLTIFTKANLLINGCGIEYCSDSQTEIFATLTENTNHKDDFTHHGGLYKNR